MIETRLVSKKADLQIRGYTRFVVLTRYAMIPLCAYPGSLFGHCSRIPFIDSTPVAVCHNARIHKHRVFAGLAVPTA